MYVEVTTPTRIRVHMFLVLTNDLRIEKSAAKMASLNPLIIRAL